MKNLRRRSDVADWSKMTNKFQQIRDVAATSQIGRKWPMNFVESATSLRRNYNKTAKKNGQWSLTNLQRCCDVAGLLNYIGHFRPISGVADSSEFIGHFRPICDVAATLQIHQSLFVILDQSMTSQRRCRFFKIYWLCSTKFFKN